MTIEADKQSLTPGRRVELFEFDARAQGGSLYYFCSSYKEDGPLLWQGNIYTPLPIFASGFEVNGKGAFPMPKLRISNVLLLPGAIINDIGDPLGAKVTRWVTFSHYLDDGETPNPDEHFAPQVFFVEQKTGQNRLFVEFQLASVIDQDGRYLPKRQVIRDTCTFVYRTYNADTNEFDYTNVQCPYAGTKMFKPDGTETTNPAEDQCGKRLGECRKRFEGQPLPFGGFPAVARVR